MCIYLLSVFPGGMSLLRGESWPPYIFCICGIQKSIKLMVDMWDTLSDEGLGLSAGRAPHTPESWKEGLPSHLRDEEIKAQRSGITGSKYPAYDRDANLVSQIRLSPAFPDRACRAQPTSLQPQGQVFAVHLPHCSHCCRCHFPGKSSHPTVPWLTDPAVYFSQFPSSFALCL